MNTADWLYEFRRFPHVTWINLDENLAALAAEIAIHHRLRSSDAVYAAVARRVAATLITLDAERLERVQTVVTVRRP
jgi:predicted nucleic acid-binding protein